MAFVPTVLSLGLSVHSLGLAVFASSFIYIDKWTVRRLNKKLEDNLTSELEISSNSEHPLIYSSTAKLRQPRPRMHHDASNQLSPI
jgi:hypothetical protein